MNKISKDGIQKIVLATLMFGGVLYCYFTMLLGPLATQQARAEKRIAELGPRVEAARKQIKRTQALEVTAPEATEKVETIAALIPDGAPVAWFPPRMSDFFKRQGIEKISARLTNEQPEKEMPGYRRLFWSLDLPKADFVSLAIAIAGLENEEPLLEINTIQVSALHDDAQNQHALLSIATIAKQ